MYEIPYTVIINRNSKKINFFKIRIFIISKRIKRKRERIKRKGKFYFILFRINYLEIYSINIQKKKII
jgi:hypothetical protein